MIATTLHSPFFGGQQYRDLLGGERESHKGLVQNFEVKCMGVLYRARAITREGLISKEATALRDTRARPTLGNVRGDMTHSIDNRIPLCLYDVDNKAPSCRCR